MCLKIENYYLKIFIKIRAVKKCIEILKYYLKIKNGCIKT